MTRNRSAILSDESALSRTKSNSRGRSAQAEKSNSFTAFLIVMVGVVGSIFGLDLLNEKNSVSQQAGDRTTISVPGGRSPGGLSSVPSSSPGNPRESSPFGNLGGSASGTPSPVFERDSILLGSFNIQALGRSKMNQPEIVKIIAATIQKFDILAVQELRDKSEKTVPEILDIVNANGARYEAVVSRRMNYGSSNYFEQLVYFYDSTQIEILAEPYIAADPRRLMHRQPFVAHFRYRSRYPQDSFSFVLMNVHTDPDRTAIEFEAMEEIIPAVKANHPAEDDFILLGDLNEEPIRFVKYRFFNDQWSAVPSHWKTNTRETENYDNFVFDKSRTSEFLGNAGVMNLKTYFGLSFQQALEVSDHMPVWAQFSTRETNSALLTQQPGNIR